MAKESLNKIRAAEIEAKEIVEKAEMIAAELISIAEREGKEHLEAVTREAEAENKAKLVRIREKTEEMLENSRIQSAESANGLRNIAQPHIRNAVKLIVQGIFEQCQ